MHYLLSERPHKHYGSLYPYISSNGGMKQMLFHVNLLFPTYQSIWLSKFGSISPELSYILQAFSEFKIGIYEQALLEYYKPGLNTNYITQFHFFNWEPGYSKGTSSYFDMSHVPNIMNSVNSTTFDFSLYFDYCKVKGIEPVDQSWLEWFVGFCERRSSYQSFGHTNSLTIRMQDTDFLHYIKETLQLSSTPFYREKEGNQYLIKGTNDIELMSSIFYKNIITDTYYDTFIKFAATLNKKVLLFNNEFSGVTPTISLDNGWLSGVIDAHCSFSFDKDYPMVRMALQNKKGIALAIIALLGYGNYNEKRSVLVIKGEKAIQPLLDYLEKYPLKYQNETYNWYKENLRKYVKKNRSDAIAKQQLETLFKQRPSLIYTGFDLPSPFTLNT